jgi:DNA-binding transcriptional ArsR family regulator
MRHPLRAEILVLLSERVASARGLESELAERHGEVHYETIAYHLRKLRALNCIELVHVARSRGNEQFFRATVRAVFDTSDMEALSEFSAESKLVSYAQMIVRDIRESIEAGRFKSHPDTTVLRTLHFLDAEGLHRFGELMLDFNESLIELAAESSERLRGSGEEGLSVETGLLSFVRP